MAAVSTGFEDRTDAGRRLAARLLTRHIPDPVVLALPRGGVPVAYEVAKSLDAPLDLVLVRKIAAPWQPELALGAVADGEHVEIALNTEIIAEMGVSEDQLRREVTRQLVEIERRRALYLAGHSPISLSGKTAIVVDDGIATGATVQAALRSVRRRGPKRLILAVPVAPSDTLARLREEVDEIVCLAAPIPFDAIGAFYRDFTQTSDEQVIGLVRRNRRDKNLEGPQAGLATSQN